MDQLQRVSQNTVFDYPLNSCFTYTFKAIIGDPGNNTLVTDTRTVSSGVIYLCGIFENTGASFLQLLDYDGTIRWSKIITQPGRSIYINSFRESLNGNLVLVGTSSLPDQSDKKIFLAQTDSTGVLQWSKTLEYPGYQGKAVSVLPGRGICFTGQDDSTIVYGKLDFSGNLIKLSKMRPMNSGSITGMTADEYNSWYIAYSGIDSSRHAGMLIQIKADSGDIFWVDKFGGNSLNSDFIFHDIELTNIRPRIIGIYSKAGSPYRLFKATVNGTSQTETLQIFSFPGISFDTTSQGAIAPLSDVIAFNPSSSLQVLYSFKTINEAYPDTIIDWAIKHTLPSKSRSIMAVQAFDGGFVFTAGSVPVSGTAQSNLIKTDSIGSVKNCEGSHFTVYDTIEYLPYIPLTSFNENPVNAILQNTVTLMSNGTLPIAFSCKALNCPPPVQIDSCLSSYVRRYRGASFCDLATSILIDDQNQLLMSGVMRDNPYEPSSGYSFLAKTDANGTLLQREKFQIGRNSFISNMITLRDGNILLIGSSSYTSPFSVYDTSYITLTKITPGWGLIWNTSIPIFNVYSAIYGALESADGSIFLNYVEGPGFCATTSLIKLNTNGGVMWMKDYDAINSCIFGYRGSITQDNDYVYLVNYANGIGMLMMKIRKTDGTVIWNRGFNIPGVSQFLVGENISFIGNNLIMNGRADNNGEAISVVMIIDKDGNLVNSRYYEISSFKMLITQNSEVVLVGPTYPSWTFMRLDSNLNLINSKQVYLPYSGSQSMQEGADGSIYDAGYFFYPNAYNNDIALRKYSPHGELGSCFADTIILNSGNPNIQVSNPVVNTYSTTVTLKNLPVSNAPYSLQENYIFCSTISSCNSISVVAPTGICDTLEQTILVNRNNGCTAPVYFSWNDSSLQIISRTDSSLTIKATRSGTIRFNAKIFTGCIWIEDSTEVPVSIIKQPLQLGPDTSHCPSNTIIINAHEGYQSYLWNDGSADSVISVSSPGDYWVEVTDACGNTFRDTIRVYAASPIPLDAGPDLTKCNDEILTLSAPGGFISYSWAPDYNISTLTGQSVTIQPLADTSYFLRAEKTPGCFAYDTIHISVFHSLPLDLGADTSFCNGQRILLNAGSQFNGYSWSTGETSQQIRVNTSGEYIFTGTSDEGCISKDSIRVLNVWQLPLVTLDKDSALCKGGNRLLQAGNFQSYRWQDGTNLPSLNVNSIGKYYVTVTDIHGCEGSDTTTITLIRNLPANFLPEDTSICSYESLFIQPVYSYPSYLWNTGETTKIKQITGPGIYSLEVKDAFQCRGNDSLLVLPKECLSGFFIPSAFTPNGDGRNDFFKPILGGIVAEYQFTVYNRWGQVVFSSNELNKGWDGKYSGVPQDGNVFIWSCRFRFEGGMINFKKGSFVLIR